MTGELRIKAVSWFEKQDAATQAHPKHAIHYCSNFSNQQHASCWKALKPQEVMLK